ncbi:MAG: HhH-GPD family protein [Chloroflexi bacterium]|nr:HhH-GPD family protein [Chloroflexota bacterium]
MVYPPASPLTAHPGRRSGTIAAMSNSSDRLHFTGNDAADRFLVEEPLALLIGYALDQQVTVQKAFSGPLELRARLGHLDAGRIGAMDPSELDRVFRDRPALHRFPGSMAGKVQALCAVVAERYGNDAGRIWRDAADGPDLRARLKALPGFGDMKVQGMLAILARRLGVDLPGMAEVLPTYPTLGDVDSPEALARYQAGKRAYKAELRAAAGPPRA